jgi:hypothetical protein
LSKVAPVGDAVFRAWLSHYSFDHGNLAAAVDAVDDSSPDWRLERVSYTAAYGDERIPAYLFLPKNATPPYQTIVYFPGSGVISRRSAPAGSDFDRINYVMRSGRALIYPIYKSTHERGDVIVNDYPSTTAVWRDHMVMWSKDIGRTIDYLLTRPDIQKDKIGYLGNSWGSGMAPLFLAVEPRLSIAVLNVGGFYLQPALPEADPVNFRLASEDPRTDAERALSTSSFPQRRHRSRCLRAWAPRGRQAARALRCLARAPAQRDHQGKRRLDGQVLGAGQVADAPSYAYQRPGREPCRMVSNQFVTRLNCDRFSRGWSSFSIRKLWPSAETSYPVLTEPIA